MKKAYRSVLSEGDGFNVGAYRLPFGGRSEPRLRGFNLSARVLSLGWLLRRLLPSLGEVFFFPGDSVIEVIDVCFRDGIVIIL